MLTYKQTAMVVCLLGNYTVFAGTMGDASTQSSKFYLGIEGGDSISMNTHFQPVAASQQTFYYPSEY